MKRWKHESHGMDLKPGGEWIRYEDHVEVMKRIAGEQPAEPVAWQHEITEPDEYAQKMYSASVANPWGHWLQEHRDKCTYKVTPLYAAPAPTASPARAPTLDDCLGAFEAAACKETYQMRAGVKAVMDMCASPAALTETAAPVAPWPDFHGQPIRHGDRLRHEDGTEFTAVHLHGHDYEGDAWRAVYDDATVSRLGLQIGDKGRAVLAVEKGNG